MTSPSVPTFRQEQALLKNAPANRNDYSKRASENPGPTGARYQSDGKDVYTAATPPRPKFSSAIETDQDQAQPRTSSSRKLSRTLPAEDTRGENKRRDTEAKIRYREEQFREDSKNKTNEKEPRIDLQMYVDEKALTSVSPRLGEPR